MPGSKFSTILIAAAVILVVVAGLHQAQLKGFLPIGNINLSQQPATQQTNRVVNEENAVISVVNNTSPSVVAIGEVEAPQSNVFNPFDPFSTPQQMPQSGNPNNTIGTGFVVSDKGIIVTNKHVVSDTGVKYTVVTKDNQKYNVTKIYRDPILDLAIVQIDGSLPAGGLKALEFGDSSKLQVGQTAIAIGNALGQFTNTVTTGIISGLGRKVVAGDGFGGSEESLDDLVQTDAAINPGNSGGPLLNSAGQVIGVNVATTQGAQNIGFAIPINSVKSIIDEFVTKGTVSRPFLGVQYRFISRDVALLNSVPQGAYVQDVVSGAAAEKAGVKAGDIITKINGSPVDSENKISDTIAKMAIGQSVQLEVWRDSKTQTLTATLQELPAQ